MSDTESGKGLGPDFMSRLREGIQNKDPGNSTEQPDAIKRYAPPSIRDRSKNKTRNQTIAEFIIALPYREAMAMGKGIAEKLKVGETVDSTEALTAAIQAWAWEWETFEDEARPGSE